MYRIASPIAWLDDEQAETVHRFGPVKPNRMAMWPAAAFAMSAGTMNGDTRPGPFSSSTRCAASRVWMPPIPVAKITPARSDGTSGSPASSHARAADETP